MKLVGNSNRRVAKLKTLSAFGETVNKQRRTDSKEGWKKGFLLFQMDYSLGVKKARSSFRLMSQEILLD